jgi:hypothetical protein
MKSLTRISLLFAVVLSGCQNANVPSLSWDEAESGSYTEQNHGIPVYGKATVDYKKNGKSILEIDLADPVIVSVAAKPEGWGHFQFPEIKRATNGSLMAIWNMQDDAISSYGKPGLDSAVSHDGGKTWVAANGETTTELLLPGGDHLTIYRPVAPELSTLSLPASLTTAPAHDGATSDPFTLYKVSELPDQLQGVYVKRLRKGESSWIEEHNILNDPHLVRYSRSGLFPVFWGGDMKVAEDGSVVAGIYPGLMVDMDSKVEPSGTFFYRSTDEGRTWNVLGRIAYLPDLALDPNGAKRRVFGFTEPAFEILSDGTFLCVQRTRDGQGNSPMYASRSFDKGVSWSKPEVMAPFGVLPRLLQLENGVVVLASGRPGVQLRFSTDPGATEWTDPFEMLSWEGEGAPSCGYTELLAMGPDRFLLIYSDFKHGNETGELRKAIKVREVVVRKK